MKHLTRRQLAAVLVPAAVGLQAQTRTQPTPDQELAAARDRLKANGEALARLSIPQATEPAFQFKA